MINRFPGIFAFMVYFMVIQLNAAVPIDITNTGVISVDQETEQLIIEGDVEIHLAPFYLSADHAKWDQKKSILSLGDTVNLRLAVHEPGAERFQKLMHEWNPGLNEEFYELLSSEFLHYNTETQQLMPVGKAQVQLGQARLVGQELSFDLSTKEISTGSYRIGVNSFLLYGDSMQAEENLFFAKNAEFSIGEPGLMSFHGRAKEIHKDSDDSVLFKGVFLKLGPIPLLYLPKYRHHLEKKVWSLTGNAGVSGDLGSYLELQPKYQPHENLSLYADINGFSKRGVLAGPGFDVQLNSTSGHRIQSRLDSGYIKDHGDRGFGFLGKPIDVERYYYDWKYLHHYNHHQFIGQLQRWSDSEILRDFDSSRFRASQQPESFFEYSWVKNNLAINLATHLEYEDFECAKEKLPEYRFELLPSPFWGSGVYHAASFTGSHLRQNDPHADEVIEYSRYRAYYELLCPIRLSSWIDFIPKGAFQSLRYKDVEQFDGSFENHHLELGFDLNAYLFGEWGIQNEIWDISGIRHLLTPTIQFRRVDEQGGSSESLLASIEYDILKTGLDDIDLSAHTHLDDLENYSLWRVGLLNRIVAKSSNNELRELLKLDIFHDTYLPKDRDKDDYSMLVANVRFAPAYWLKLNLQSRFDTNDFKLNDLFARLQLVDGDVWSIDLSSQFMSKSFEQYLIRVRSRLTENVTFVSELGYDTEKSRFFEQIYGFQFEMAHYWDLLVSVRIREGSLRNNDTKFEVKLLTNRF